MVNATKIKTLLEGFSEILDINLKYNEHQRYDLILVLQSDRREQIQLFCRDISGFNLGDFGGELTRIFQLRVEDVSSRQLERIKLKFWDRAVDRLNFACADAEVTTLDSPE